MAGDPHYNNVSLLLHMDGADGSTTFTDSSPRPKTATVTGGVKISTAQSQFGGASSQFDGVDDELFFASNSDFGLGTGDFTLEAWVRRKNADCALFDPRTSGSDTGAMVAYISATGYLAWWDNSARISATGYIPVDTWTHVAYCRAAGVLTMYVGGVATRSDVKGSDMGSARALRIGRDVGGNADFYGHLDDIRVTKGVSRYTANFTPPAAPFPDRAPQLSGTVKNASNAPAARLIRAVREDTGALSGYATSDAGTGNYTINCSSDGAHSLIAYPAAGENLPALTLRGVVPV